MTSHNGRMIRESHEIFEVDRISHLPGDLIESILDFLPARDAARTCVLSSEWRYVWVNHPHLVLDRGFWDDIQRHKSPQNFFYLNIVNSILLYHAGHIRTFFICFSGMSYSMTHFNVIVDLWLSSLFSNKKLKKLGISSTYKNRYKVPSWVFSATELTHLSLFSCDVQKFVGECFTGIRTLVLFGVHLGSGVLTAPLLTYLSIEACGGILDFDISAPRLTSLVLHRNDFVKLKPFLTCTAIDSASLISTERLFSSQKTGYFDDGENLNLVKLLAAWPRISRLTVDKLHFKYLVAGGISSCILQPNYLRYLALCDFKLESGLMPWILCIMENSPLLHTFEITFPLIDLEAVNDIIEPITMNLRMAQLCTVKMLGFSASRDEVNFTKFLLRCAPVLKKLLIAEDKYCMYPNKRIDILKKLLILQRAYPKADISFGSNIF